MKRLLTFSAMMFLLVGGLFAQKLSYQAVVRNSANELVVNTPLTVEVGVLDAFGTVQYAERHTTTSNQNGLIVLTIGEGTVTVGTSVADVDWNGAVIQSVVKDGSTIVATINSPVNAVPYALQAASAGGSISQVNADWEATSGVAEILHKPTIPTTVAELTDASNYVTNADLAAAGYLTAESDPTVPAWAKETTKPAYNYSEITGTPTIPTTVAELTDAANYATTADLADKANAADVYTKTETDNLLNDKANVTDIHNSTITIQKNGDLVGSFTLNQAGDQTINLTVPTGGGGGGSVPQTINISGNVITLSDGGGSVTLPAETDPTVPAWAKESTKPAYDYAEITNTPDLSVYLTTESDPTVPAWAKESTKPAYDYAEITNTPDLTPYLTTETDPTVPAWAKESVKPTYDYSEITNTPDLTPYLTTETDPTVPAWAKESVKPTYDYVEITNTPDLSVYATTTDMNTALAEKANVTDVYSKTEADDVMAAAIHDSIAGMRTQLNAMSTQLGQLVAALSTLQARSEAFPVTTNGQTAFTLSSAPYVSGEVVCFVNGVMVGSKASHVITVSGANVTYNPAYNYDYALKVGDVVTFMYININF